MSNINLFTMEQLIRDAIDQLKLSELDEWAIFAQARRLMEGDPCYDAPRERRRFTNVFLRAFASRPFVITTSWDRVPNSDGDARS